MTEEEYLELKEYLKEGVAYVEELRKQFPPATRMLTTAFLPYETRPLTDEDVKYRELKLGLLCQELDNDLIADLIRTYETDPGRVI